MDYDEAIEAGKLFHLHENGQGEPAFDRDLAAGDESLYALLDRIWQLKRPAIAACSAPTDNPCPRIATTRPQPPWGAPCAACAGPWTRPVR